MTIRMRALGEEEAAELARMARSRTLGAGLVRRAQIVQHATEYDWMMASTVADNVSTNARPLAADSSRNRRCLRARAPMFASAYTYFLGWPQDEAAEAAPV